MNEKISVVIPMFNSEKYIRRAIESVQRQTYTDIEIICVDDHSTDGTRDICYEISQKDQRVVLKKNKKKGVSSARNLGINSATGKYLAFVDSDDWIEYTMYEEMIKKMQQESADIVVCNLFKDYDDGEIAMENTGKVENCFDGFRFIDYIFKRDLFRGVTAYSVNKLYRLDIFKETGVKYSEDLRRAEDVLMMTELALKISKIVYINKPMYHYYQNSESTTHTNNYRVLMDSLVAYQRVIDLLDSVPECKPTIVWIKRFYAYHSAKIFEKVLHNKEVDLYECLLNEIKKYYAEYIETNKNEPERIEWINDLIDKGNREYGNW